MRPRNVPPPIEPEITLTLALQRGLYDLPAATRLKRLQVGGNPDPSTATVELELHTADSAKPLALTFSFLDALRLANTLEELTTKLGAENLRKSVGGLGS